MRVTTNLGAFVIEMQRDRAPLTVENFLATCAAGYYTNTLFHRVISNFVIQGGGVGTRLQGQAHAEADRQRSRATASRIFAAPCGLARASGPHSGDCQFYVNVADNADLDPLPTRWGYAVFGTRHRRHGSGRSHQRVAHRLDGTVQAGRAAAGRWSSRRSSC